LALHYHDHHGSRRTAPPGRLKLAVVGGGIVGLAHAWAAARRGWHVRLFERHDRAQGASIRNFGMVWPIGQPNGPLHRSAMHSRALWQELSRETGLWSRPCGSLHLAYREDELAVLEEFARLAPALGYDCELLSAQDIASRSPAARREGLLGGLWSASEMCVDPREIIANMPSWLRDRYGVELHYGVPVSRVARHEVTLADGEHWNVDQIVVATGADLRMLYPEYYAAAGFRRCKLQMMRTPPQPHGWMLGPMLAGGLTLRHYAAFGVCKSLAALKDRVAAEAPELNRYGIHVMASQNGRGEVVLGDSHEYGDDVAPFDKAEIDELILRELRRMIDLPDWTIQERWHGIYPTAPDTVQYVAEPESSVHIAIASGGCGMTMSFGLADQQWSSWHGPPEAAAINEVAPHSPAPTPAIAVGPSRA
jgi:FAD dependent oxidoreductase TIGR03364